MNNQEYMQALKKALSRMKRQSRDEILQEVQSHIEQSGASSASLVERFGTPDELAKQYLEGETLVTPMRTYMGKLGKRLLMILGGSVLLLGLIGVGIAYWWTSQDDFNYADENASALTDPENPWKSLTVNQPLTITVDQAIAVFYWGDQIEVRATCKGGEPLMQNKNGVVAIRHQRCWVYLPKQAVSLQSTQGSIVIVQPKADVTMTLYQSQLRIAEKGQQYRYQIQAERTKVGELNSDDNAALQISIDGKEAMIGLYND